VAATVTTGIEGEVDLWIRNRLMKFDRSVENALPGIIGAELEVN
jgi:hypothetical protein